MRIDVKLDSNDAMLKRRGLNPSGRVQRLMTTECARQMDPYVPMRQGTLKNTRFIGPDYVLYRGPYAHYQYVGKLMVGVKTGSAYAKSGEPKSMYHRPKTCSIMEHPNGGRIGISVCGRTKASRLP